MGRKFNNKVQAIFLVLYDDAQFHAYRDAVYDDQAVEGSLAIDDVMSAIMVRDKALELPDYEEVAYAKLSAIVRSIKVVERRLYASREKRRSSTVAGDGFTMHP